MVLCDLMVVQKVEKLYTLVKLTTFTRAIKLHNKSNINQLDHQNSNAYKSHNFSFCSVFMLDLFVLLFANILNQINMISCTQVFNYTIGIFHFH